MNVQRFRGGLVFKAHRLLYLSTLGLRVIKKKRSDERIPLADFVKSSNDIRGCVEKTRRSRARCSADDE